MLTNAWYIAATSQDVGKSKPLGKTVAGVPLVLFRDADGQVGVLFDRCPHRNVQLSRGKMRSGCLQCPYHGWEFNAQGDCVKIPSLTSEDKIPKQAHAHKIPLKEQQGFIWVWVGDKEPQGQPFDLPYENKPGWGTGRLQGYFPNSIDNVIENFVDCPHTGYVHGGLFRSPASYTTETELEAVEDGVIINIQEDNSSGLLGKVLVGSSEMTHQDRFIFPSIVQVAYGFGPKKQIIGYQICTPVSEFETQVYVYVAWHMGWLNPLVKLLFPLVGRVILKQDLDILANQSQVIQAHGEKFVSVQADTANLWIKAAKSRIQKGEAPPMDRSKKVRFRL